MFWMDRHDMKSLTQRSKKAHESDHSVANVIEKGHEPRYRQKYNKTFSSNDQKVWKLMLGVI